MAGSAKRTTDHETIRRWIEERGGHPATVSRTAEAGEPGILRVDFPGFSGEQSLEPISWEAFFQAFEDNQLAFLFQEEKDGELSRFSKFVARSESEISEEEPERAQTSENEERTMQQNGERMERQDGERMARTNGQRAGGRRTNGERRTSGRGLKVRDVMSADPALCVPGTPIRKIARMMIDCDCGAVPVVDGLDTRQPVGIVTDRDIVARGVAEGLDPRELSAIDCMSAPVITVAPDDDVENVIYMLEQAQVRRVVVVDDAGCVIGVVAQADLVLSKPELGVELVESISLQRGDEDGFAEEGGPGAFH